MKTINAKKFPLTLVVSRPSPNDYGGERRSILGEHADQASVDAKLEKQKPGWVEAALTIVAGDVRIPLETLYSALHGTSIGGLRDAIARAIGGALRGAGYRPTWTKVLP